MRPMFVMAAWVLREHRPGRDIILSWEKTGYICRCGKNLYKTEGCFGAALHCVSCLAGVGCYTDLLEAKKEFERIYKIKGNLMSRDKDGLRIKYNVYKVANGSLINNCFVLRPDKDPAAVEALKRYAETTENLQLAEDIRKWIATPNVNLVSIREGK